MKKIFLIALFFLCTFPAVSQDVIVLKKDEMEIKCWILSVSDTLITYKTLNGGDDTPLTVRRVDVLSFFLDTKSRNRETNLMTGYSNATVAIPLKKKRKPVVISDSSNPDKVSEGVLAPYRSGETVTGYVVTNNGDTVSGIIKIKNVAENQIYVNFTDESGTVTKYNTSDLRAYGYGSVHYERINTGYKKTISNDMKSEDGTYYLHRQENGSAKLFRFYTLFFPRGAFLSDPNPPSYMAKISSHYLLTNPHGNQILTKGRTLKGSVNRLYNDNKDIMEKVRLKGIREDELPELIRSYNHWYENRK